MNLRFRAMYNRGTDNSEFSLKKGVTSERASAGLIYTLVVMLL